MAVRLEDGKLWVQVRRVDPAKVLDQVRRIPGLVVGVEHTSPPDQKTFLTFKLRRGTGRKST